MCDDEDAGSGEACRVNTCNTNYAHPIHQPDDYNREFDSQAYLDHFYSAQATEAGQKIALFAIPMFMPRLKDGVTVLDVGSGPTIYMALLFRDKASAIYLTDYTTTARHELLRWINKQSTFDWTPIAKSVSLMEGVGGGTSTSCYLDMIDRARAKTRAVWFCDVHRPELYLADSAPASNGGVVDDPTTFDVVTTVFCLESACATLDEYHRALGHIVARLRPGGCLMLGSVIEDTLYAFGTERFQLLYLTVDDIKAAMAAHGLDVEGARQLEYDGAFFIAATKVGG